MTKLNRDFSAVSEGLFPGGFPLVVYVWGAPNIVSPNDALLCDAIKPKNADNLEGKKRHRRALGNNNNINLQFAKMKNVVKLNLAAAGNCFSHPPQLASVAVAMSSEGKM